jgi:hypothetical protein
MTEHRLALKAVKAFHTFAWFTIEACMVFVLYAGIRGKSDRRAVKPQTSICPSGLRTTCRRSTFR